MSEILWSRREFRQELAARPLAEKLRLLDLLRERNSEITASRPSESGVADALELKANSDEMKVAITFACATGSALTAGAL